MSTDWEPPRCSHGNIIMGCPKDDCPEQTAYLEEQEVGMLAYDEAQRKAVRAWLGLPEER